MPDLHAHWLAFLALAAAAVHLLGLASCVHVVLKGRTPQGATAWMIVLLTLPYIALPLYWTFGRNRFSGYVVARRRKIAALESISETLVKHAPDYKAELSNEHGDFRVLERLAQLPFTHGNHVQLLVDGEATFDAIFAAIEQAQQYVLLQFYIVRDDEIGRELKRRLIEKARAGVRIYFLFDAVGSGKLRRYGHELREAGVQFIPFSNSRTPWTNRMQINFRNHRKIVIVDGQTGFVGGHNVGDEYLGRDPEFGHWRDTHCQVNGPAVTCTQLAFLEDWYFATQEVPELNWNPQRAEANQNVLVLPTGPADELDTCGLFFVECIHAARKRLWIASPYFVPDHQVVSALQLAALRGVDVRVMLPERADHLLVYLSAFSYLAETEPAGVKVYRYHRGFLHQKTMVVDDAFATVGTANLDNRSFRLNFEITLAAADRTFARQVQEMFEQDFAHSELLTRDELDEHPFVFRLAVSVARLFAPML